MTTPWRRTPNGLTVRLRVTPRASRDAIDAIEATADGPALKARVRAVPSDNAANEAVVRLLAEWIGIPKSAVAVSSGAKSRVKLLTVAGDPVVLERALIEKATRLGGPSKS